MLKRFLIFWIGCFIFATRVFAASQSEDYQMHETLLNASGSTATSSSLRLYDSLGEAAIGQVYGNQYSLQVGLINDYFLPPPTPTITPTLGPSPTITCTPLFSSNDFHGQIIEAKYFFVAPNPTQGVNVVFKFLLRQSADVEVRIYTPRSQHVWTKSFSYYPQGWNTFTWNASGMANGVYYYIVEAKANGITEKLGIKKIALLK